MPFNGSGVFERTPGTLIANQGALVSAQVNNETNNAVDGINGKINRDGKLAFTANQPMGGFKLTGLGVGTALTDAPTLGQAQSQVASTAASVGGTVDAITLVMSPVMGAYVKGETIRWTSGGVNTITNPTVNRDAAGVKTIKKGASAALAGGDTGASGYLNTAIYNGTDFILQNPATVAAPTFGGPGSSTDNAVARFDGTNGQLVQNSVVTITDAGDVTVTSTDATSSADPALILDRFSASPAANDFLGEIQFKGRDNGAGTDNYAHILSRALDVSAGSEDGQLTIRTAVAGAQVDQLLVSDGLTVGDATGGAPGLGKINATGYEINGVDIGSGGGAWDHISTLTPSAAATAVQVGLSSYKALRITGINLLPASNGVSFQTRISSDNGSSYIATSTYSHSIVGTDSGGIIAGRALGSTAFTIDSCVAGGNGQIGNTSTDGGLDFEMIISSFNAAQKTKFLSSYAYGNESAALESASSRALQTAQTAMNAIQFLFSTGNITSGTIIIEGTTG